MHSVNRISYILDDTQEEVVNEISNFPTSRDVQIKGENHYNEKKKDKKVTLLEEGNVIEQD